MDIDQFTERAAICEFDGGMSRFEAETLAAKEQGVARWQALREITNANGNGHPAGSGDSASAVARELGQKHLPGMQRTSEKEDRPMSERDAQTGRDRVVLPALRAQGRGFV